MKKTISIIICFLLSLCVISGCSQTKTEGKAKSKLKIVTTIFPEYDWVRQILGNTAENVELTMLLDNGVDLHSFQPTAEDIVKISSCDLFIYTGGESDKWAEDILKDKNGKENSLNLIDELGELAKTEETVSGMQDDHEHDEEEHDESEHEEEIDEHIWLSLKNADRLCGVIAEKLAEIDGTNAKTYTENAAKYRAELNKLDEKYSAAVSGGSKKTILFADRFPFRYLVDDYGLKYFAAFSGCSAESEASFETVSFLAKKIDELGLDTVITLEGSKHKIAETVIANTKEKSQKILVLDSMQSVTDTKSNYLSVMEKNLEAVSAAVK